MYKGGVDFGIPISPPLNGDLRRHVWSGLKIGQIKAEVDIIVLMRRNISPDRS